MSGQPPGLVASAPPPPCALAVASGGDYTSHGRRETEREAHRRRDVISPRLGTRFHDELAHDVYPLL